MDSLWMHIVHTIAALTAGLDYLVQPINAVHPALTIAILAGATIGLTTGLKKRFKTKRYQHLEKEFNYWFAVRQQALESSNDPVKAKLMAKNIDQSTLNKVYYDYFFEGLLNNLVTTYLPILCVAAYINEAFRPENLDQMINQSSLFIISSQNGTAVSPLAWFVLCLLGLWIGKILLQKIPSWVRGKPMQEQVS